MKPIFSLLSALLVLLSTARGEPPPVGFVRVVHVAAAGEGALQVKLDGGELRPQGYALGQFTGGLGLPAGEHAVELAKPGVASHREKLNLAAGETLTLVVYAEKLPPPREGEPPRWALRVRKLAAAAQTRGYWLTLLSVCPRDEVVVRTAIEAKRKMESTALGRFVPVTLDLGGRRGGVEVRLGDEALAEVPLDDPGNYVVLLYEDADGRVRALVFYDPKFEVAG